MEVQKTFACKHVVRCCWRRMAALCLLAVGVALGLVSTAAAEQPIPVPPVPTAAEQPIPVPPVPTAAEQPVPVPPVPTAAEPPVPAAQPIPVAAQQQLVPTAAQQPVPAQQQPIPAPTNGYFAPPSAPATAPNGQFGMWEPEPIQPENPFSATVALNQDSFFGFYPTLNANYNISEGLDFTFYSILWTTPDFSPFGGGQGLWTEVGAGFQTEVMDGLFTVNPQFGFLNGALLSGASRARAFEGVIPSLIINHDDVWTEGQFYMGYYIATRSPRTNDFLHWWINGGVKPFAESESWMSIISTGLHFEQLRLTRSRAANPQDIYLWLGPYVQFSLHDTLSLRFTAGWDLRDRVAADFYKAAVAFSF